MPTNKILITAFEPFGGAVTNITQDILSALPRYIGKAEVIKQCLPVSFERAPIALREIITEHNPDMLLLLGQCPDGENIRLERFAINMMDSTKGDNDGYIPNEETIYANQPLALQTLLPIKELLRFCTDDVLPVKISNSAGLYVCNRVYYEALYLHQQAIFVHVPKNMERIIALRVLEYLLQKITACV